MVAPNLAYRPSATTVESPDASALVIDVAGVPTRVSSTTPMPVTLSGGDRELVVSTYFVKTAFSGASVSDTVTSTQVIDVSTTPTTISVIWRNQTTGVDFGSTPSAANLTLVNSQAMSLTQLSSLIGNQNDTAATSDTGTFSLFAFVKRQLQNWTAKLPAALGATTKANSFPVVFPTDAAVDVIGRVGASCTQGSFVPTVTASSAYATGNAVGGLITVTNALRTGVLSGLLQWVKVTSASAQASSSFDVFLFNAAPTAPTDKTAYSVASADLAKLISVIHCTDITTAGGSIHQADNAAKPFLVPSGTSIYAVIVVRGTPTFTASSDVTLSVGIVQD